jgi:type III secretory pathway component EscV
MFKPDSLSTPEQIFKECQEIQAFITSGVISEGNALVERAHILNEYSARTTKMLADAKWHLDDLTNSEIMKLIKNELPEMLSLKNQNKFIESVCKDYNYLVNWLDRLNANLTHQLDMLRTLISREVKIQNI